MPPTPYVMFGHSSLFGDYVEIIHALGGYVKKVVTNMPDPTPEGRKSFATRVAEYQAWVRDLNLPRPPQTQDLDQFTPEPQERYVVGFRGRRASPLHDRLHGEWGIFPEALVHPTAMVSPTAELGEGVIINTGAVIASRVKIGAYSLINRGASLGHDCHLAPFTNIGPGSHLASVVRTGEGAVVGIGATILEELFLGACSVVAAGASVIRDVAPYTMVAGVPAVQKKELPR